MKLYAIGFTLVVLGGCATGVADPYEIPADGSGGQGGDPSGSGGTGGRGGTFGSGGSGGNSASGGTGGASSGGSGGSGGRGGSGGSGATGGGGGSGGSGGSSGSAGRGGSGGTSADAGAGCTGTPDWMMGGTYAMGDKVRAVCSTASGGVGATCTVGKTYAWSCSLALACGVVGPGTANWGLAWTMGNACN